MPIAADARAQSASVPRLVVAGERSHCPRVVISTISADRKVAERRSSACSLRRASACVPRVTHVEVLAINASIELDVLVERAQVFGWPG
jgi:hypothetical protein